MEWIDGDVSCEYTLRGFTKIPNRLVAAYNTYHCPGCGLMYHRGFTKKHGTEDYWFRNRVR